MTKTIDDFYKDLGIRESSGQYDAVNTIGYLGLYQMGEKAMVDAGYYKPQKEYKNRWDGEFTGKDGVYSKEDFLNNPIAQKNAVRAYHHAVWSYIKNEAEKYDDKIVKKSQKKKIQIRRERRIIQTVHLLRANGLQSMVITF